MITAVTVQILERAGMASDVSDASEASSASEGVGNVSEANGRAAKGAGRAYE